MKAFPEVFYKPLLKLQSLLYRLKLRSPVSEPSACNKGCRLTTDISQLSITQQTDRQSQQGSSLAFEGT